MIKEHESAKLDQWIERAEQSGLKELKGLAEVLKRDKEAVFGALNPHLNQHRNGTGSCVELVPFCLLCRQAL